MLVVSSVWLGRCAPWSPGSSVCSRLGMLSALLASDIPPGQGRPVDVCCGPLATASRHVFVSSCSVLSLGVNLAPAHHVVAARLPPSAQLNRLATAQRLHPWVVAAQCRSAQCRATSTNRRTCARCARQARQRGWLIAPQVEASFGSLMAAHKRGMPSTAAGNGQLALAAQKGKVMLNFLRRAGCLKRRRQQ